MTKVVTEIWYSIHDGGDGSAYPRLMESEELCILDQKYHEGWAEDCYGWFTIESDGPIHIKNRVATVQGEINELEEELNEEYMKEYERTGQFSGMLARKKKHLAALKALKVKE